MGLVFNFGWCQTAIWFRFALIQLVILFFSWIWFSIKKDCFKAKNAFGSLEKKVITSFIHHKVIDSIEINVINFHLLPLYFSLHFNIFSLSAAHVDCPFGSIMQKLIEIIIAAAVFLFQSKFKSKKSFLISNERL